MNVFRFKLHNLAAVWFLLVAMPALATPDLQPYQPSGWSDKIVVSTVTGTSTDSSPLTTADTLYVDWAVANFGTTSAGSFTVSLYVDGVLTQNWGIPSMAASTYSYAQDYSIGQLSAGTHTVTITADSGNTVTESNESNNTYTKTITVGGSSLPNLAPYQPSGWSDKIVVSTFSGSITDSPSLSTTNTLYVDWAVVNNGNSTASNFVNSLYVDGVLKNTWNTTTLAASSYTYAQNYSIGQLSAGSHTITITADASNNVAESSESDNSYTKNITVGAPALPNLTPYQPSGWSDKLVVSTASNNFTNSPSPSTADTLYVDWAVINNGTVAAGAFNTSLYVDGALIQTWGSGSLPASSYTYVQNYSIGSLSAGTHSVSIVADTGNTVGESIETDNSYTNTFTVTSATAPAPSLGTPVNTSTNQSTTPVFSWSSLSGVTGYRILVATSAADLPTDPSAGSGGPSVVLNATSTNNSYTPTVPLNPGTTYYWEVHGRSGADDGIWSSVSSFTTGVPLSGLTIIPNFDSSITSDPQAATIESTINAAIAVYQSDFSDQVTVHITFSKMGSGLGRSSAYHSEFSYSSYRAALASHSTTVDDAAALASLPAGTVNPVTGDPNVELKLPLARALGFSADPSAGQPDGTIYLNTAIMNLSGASTISTNYSLFSTVSHEIDEVLGFDSALNGLTNGAPVPTGGVFPEDMFRYDGTGARSFTTAATAVSYFSLDGTTDLARFNQEQGGDYQDWYSFFGGQTPEVQDAYATQGSSPVLGVELRVLDAIGFTRVVAQAAIVASAGAGGTISPSGTFNKSVGLSQLFTATPDATHFVNQWLVDSAVAQTGGTTYTLANIQTNHTVQVTFGTKTNQTITFGPLPSVALGEPPYSLTASASSGLPVSFGVVSGPGTISGSAVTITNTGIVVVQASQAGNTYYNAATPVNQSLVVYLPPNLGFSGAGNSVVISWNTNVAGFSLLGSTNLASAGSWQPVLPTPLIVNGRYVVTNNTSGAREFYRLKK